MVGEKYLGYAHGFCVLSKTAWFHCKVFSYYDLGSARGILWNDHYIAVERSLKNPILSESDKGNQPLYETVLETADLDSFSSKWPPPEILIKGIYK